MIPQSFHVIDCVTMVRTIGCAAHDASVSVCNTARFLGSPCVHMSGRCRRASYFSMGNATSISSVELSAQLPPARLPPEPTFLQDDCRNGRWKKQSSAPPWSYRNRHDRLEKLCTQRNWTGDKYEWSCPGAHVTSSMLCKRLAGQRIVFIGDSLQQHFYLSFAMAMSHRADTDALGIHDSFKPTDICDGAVHIETIRNDYLNEGYAYGNEGFPRWRAFQKSWGGLLHGTGIAFPWVPALNASLSKGNTIAVINTGAKVFPPATASRHIEAVIERIKALQTQHAARLHVVWRTSFPGHPDCERAMSMRPLLSLDEPRAQPYLVAQSLPTDTLLQLFPRGGTIANNENWTLKLYHSWHVLNTSRALLEGLAIHAGWHILDVYTSSILRPDAHVSSSDCLHFCMPGPIDAWAERLIALLHQILAPPLSTMR